MRLMGSLLEKSFREELTKSWVGLRNPGNRLLSIIESQIGLIGSAFVLNWTPEESEDFYEILVNGSSVVFLEIGNKVSDCIFPQAAFYGARENVVWHLIFFTPFLAKDFEWQKE